MPPKIHESEKTHSSFNTGFNTWPEKGNDGAIMLSNEESQSNHSRTKVFAIVVLVCSLCLLWLFGDCLSAKHRETEFESVTVHSTHPFNLVKYQAPAASPTPSSSAVLECFQVYQPVLTPNGFTDETTESDGSETTVAIESANTAGSCQVLLMEHVFAFSYGQPFVGT